MFLSEKMSLHRHELKCTGSSDKPKPESTGTVQTVCSVVPMSVNAASQEAEQESDKPPKRGTKGKYLWKNLCLK